MTKINSNDYKWYVLNGDFNSSKIDKFNIFTHSRFCEDIEEELKKYVDFNSFKDRIACLARYYFCSQVEYEIMVKPMFVDETKKISVYEQLEPNIEILATYIIEKYNEKIRKKLSI